jgi:hypothetical protein
MELRKVTPPKKAWTEMSIEEQVVYLATNLSWKTYLVYGFPRDAMPAQKSLPTPTKLGGVK